MRFRALAAAAALSACATAPAPIQSAPAAAPAAPSGTLAGMLHSAGRADAPSEREIVSIFGQPDIQRRDGVGAAYTYRLETCALLLLFTPDARNEMRLAEAHASARQAGAAAPSYDQCAAEVSARR